MLVIEPGEHSERMADLDAEHLAKSERHDKASQDGDKRQEIGLYPRRARHPFEELPAIKNADAVEKHD